MARLVPASAAGMAPRDAVQQSAGLGRLRRGARVEDRHRGLAVRAGPNGLDKRHVRLVLQRLHELGEASTVGRAVYLGHDLEGAVVPGTESFGQEVVGLTRGRRNRVVAGVGEALTHGEEGESDDRYQEQSQNAGIAGLALDGLRPPQPEALQIFPLRMLSQLPPLASPKGLQAEEPEHGGQKGQRGQHGQRHDEGRRQGHTVEEAHLEGKHTQEGDAHGETGEQHGPTRRVEGGDDGLLRRGTGKKLAPVPAHDEQGVVDSDAKRDEGGQDGAELGDGKDVGQEPDDGRSDAYGHQSGYEREQGAEKRSPEGEEQHDQRQEDSEAFAGRLAGSLVVLDCVAPELHVQDAAVGRLCGLDNPADRRLWNVLRLSAEVYAGQSDGAITADHARLEWGPDLTHVRQVGHPGQHGLYLLAGSRVVEGPGLGLDDDLVEITSLGREVFFQDGQSPAGVGGGEREVVGVTRPGRPGYAADQDQSEQPAGENDATVGKAPASKGYQGVLRGVGLRSTTLVGRNRPGQLTSP